MQHPTCVPRPKQQLWHVVVIYNVLNASITKDWSRWDMHIKVNRPSVYFLVQIVTQCKLWQTWLMRPLQWSNTTNVTSKLTQMLQSHNSPHWQTGQNHISLFFPADSTSHSEALFKKRSYKTLLNWANKITERAPPSFSNFYRVPKESINFEARQVHRLWVS